MQGQSTVALISSAWAGCPQLSCSSQGSTRRGEAEQSESSHAELAAAAGSAWWQCLVTLCSHLPPVLVTSLFPSPGAELGWDSPSALCCHRASLLPLHHFLPCHVPTFSLIHFRSCPTSTHIPVTSSPTTPKSFGSLPSFLHSISSQLSSHTSPIPVHKDHHCSTWG